MKIAILSPKSKTVYNFRGELVRDMLSRGNEVTVIVPDTLFSREIKTLGNVNIITLPFVKDNMSVKGDHRYYSELKRLLFQIKPDMLFCYTAKPVIYGCLAAGKAGVKKIYPMITGLGRVYSGGGIKRKALRNLVSRLYKVSLKNADKVIFQNDDDKNQFIREKTVLPGKCVKVDGSGVDMTRFEKFPLPPDPVFLMVGRIIAEKGVIEYCKAAQTVKLTHPEAKFILVGGFDSSLGAVSPQEIKSYIDDGTVEYAGEVKDPTEFYKKCSVFVLPTYYYEGLPRTILEAMSTGRAVITTDWRGCREAVTNNVNGFLVKPKDAAELAKKMLTLAENAELRAQMGENSYCICKEKYSTEKVNARMREIMGY